MTRKPLTIVFAVCHPDDEVMWAGGLLCELARLDFVRSYVVCLSGNDPTSPRLEEFEAAKRYAGYTAGVICGNPLRPALSPLPNIGETLLTGLSQMGLTPQMVDLLITHAPYGDEHRNPHHIQANRELKAWCQARRIGFSHFACMPLPGVAQHSLLKDLRRIGTLRLLQFSRCTGPWGTPRYYIQFASDPAAKTNMVQCYRSIGLDAHEAGYTMLSNPCEALYLQDDRAVAPLRAIIAAMSAPGSSPLVEKRSFLSRVKGRMRHLLGKTS